MRSVSRAGSILSALSEGAPLESSGCSWDALGAWGRTFSCSFLPTKIGKLFD